MSLLELKQQISRLSQRDRKELQTYLVRLKHETQASKRSTARRVREMKAGHLTTVDELEARYRNRD